MSDEREAMAANIRRTVGIAVLRRLRLIAEADARNEARNARWARRLGWVFALAATLAVLWLAIG